MEVATLEHGGFCGLLRALAGFCLHGKGLTYTLDAFTWEGQITMGLNYTLFAYTCSGQIARGCTQMVNAYTCGGQIATLTTNHQGFQ